MASPRIRSVAERQDDAGRGVGPAPGADPGAADVRPDAVPERISIAWALLGVALVFLYAIVRLGMTGYAAVRAGLTPFEWIVLVVLAFAFVYGEGHRAIQRRWVPRLIERVRDLPRRGFLLRLLAPLFGLSLIGGPRSDLVRGWSLAAGVTLAVFVVRALPGPWRGIVDAAVAAALTWGLVALVVNAPRAFRRVSAHGG